MDRAQAEVERVAAALREEFELYAVEYRGLPPLSTRWEDLTVERRRKWEALARRALKEIDPNRLPRYASTCLKAPDGRGHHYVPVFRSGDAAGRMICTYCSLPLKGEG